MTFRNRSWLFSELYESPGQRPRASWCVFCATDWASGSMLSWGYFAIMGQDGTSQRKEWVTEPRGWSCLLRSPWAICLLASRPQCLVLLYTSSHSPALKYPFHRHNPFVNTFVNNRLGIAVFPDGLSQTLSQMMAPLTQTLGLTWASCCLGKNPVQLAYPLCEGLGEN